MPRRRTPRASGSTREGRRARAAPRGVASGGSVPGGAAGRPGGGARFGLGAAGGGGRRGRGRWGGGGDCGGVGVRGGGEGGVASTVMDHQNGEPPGQNAIAGGSRVVARARPGAILAREPRGRENTMKR